MVSLFSVKFCSITTYRSIRTNQKSEFFIILGVIIAKIPTKHKMKSSQMLSYLYKHFLVVASLNPKFFPSVHSISLENSNGLIDRKNELKILRLPTKRMETSYFINVEAKSNEDLPGLDHPAPIIPKSNEDLPGLDHPVTIIPKSNDDLSDADTTATETKLPIKDSPFSSDLFWDSGDIPSLSYSYVLSPPPSYRNAPSSSIPVTPLPSYLPSFTPSISPIETPPTTNSPSIQPSFIPTQTDFSSSIPSQFHTLSLSQIPTISSTTLPPFNLSETVDHILSDLFESTKETGHGNLGASSSDHFDNLFSSTPTIAPSKSNSKNSSQINKNDEDISELQNSAAPQVNEFEMPPKDKSDARIFKPGLSTFFLVVFTKMFVLMNELL